MIKYHDNNGEKANERDEQGRLANNWDSAIEYGSNEYARVYFRIETPLYEHNDRGCAYMHGFDTKADRETFHQAARAALASVGFAWEREYDEPRKGKAHLYIHPMEITGTVLKDDVKAIAEALSSSSVFSLRWVDIYETVYDYTDDEYREYLETRAQDIRAYILRKARTARRKLYMESGRIEFNAGLHFRRERVGKTDQSGLCGDKVERDVTAQIVDELIEAGYLIPYFKDDARYIRTINKTEQRQKKLFIEEVAA